MTDELTEFFCTYCGNQIPLDRFTHKANTCSGTCAKQIKMARRKLERGHRCRLCNAPSTPEEREQFRKWRAQQPDAPKRGRPKGSTNKPKPAPAESAAVIPLAESAEVGAI
jgi:hypothetical protein